MQHSFFLPQECKETDKGDAKEETGNLSTSIGQEEIASIAQIEAETTQNTAETASSSSSSSSGGGGGGGGGGGTPVTCYKCGREGHITTRCQYITRIDGETLHF